MSFTMLDFIMLISNFQLQHVKKLILVVIHYLIPREPHNSFNYFLLTRLFWHACHYALYFQLLEDYSLARLLMRKFDGYLIRSKMRNQRWEKGIGRFECSFCPESVKHLAWSWNGNPYSSNGHVESSNYLWESPNTFNRDFQPENSWLGTEGWDAKSFSSWSSKEDETMIEMKDGIWILPIIRN